MLTIGFTNDFGQVIAPGDSVVVVVVCSHRVGTYKGVYLGQTDNGSVKVEVEAMGMVAHWDDDGSIASFNEIWKARGSQRKYSYKHEMLKMHKTLKNNLIYKLG